MTIEKKDIVKTVEPIKQKVNLADLLAQITSDSGLELVDYGLPVGKEVLLPQ